MSFTLRNKNENGSSSATTVAVTVTGVVAGDLVVLATGNNTGIAVNGVSDGTSSFTMLGTNITAGSYVTAIGYLLASVASGSVTYTTTFASSAGVPEIHVWVFSHVGTPQFDVERHDGQSAASGTLDTGAITTTGTDELAFVGSYHANQAIASAWAVNGVAAADHLDPGGRMSTWITMPSATFTGNGTATIASTAWSANIATFKIPGSATLKTIESLATASIKTALGTAKASLKTAQGLTW